MKALITLPVRDHINGALRSELDASGCPWLPIYGMSDLPRARSLLLTAALRHEAETIVCIDADIVPEPGQIHQLATHPRLSETSAVTGLYPLRSGKGWACHAPEEPEPDGCRPRARAGLGFAAMRASSLRRLQRRLPRLSDPEAGDWWCFCLPFIDERGPSPEYVPEDHALWQRLADVGVQLWADTRLVVGHQALMTLRSPIQQAEREVSLNLDPFLPKVDDARQGGG